MFPFTVSGLLNGDTAEDIDTPPTISTAAVSASPVGTYAIKAAGASDANYDFAYAAGTLTVDPAALTITAEDQARGFGQPNPPFTANYLSLIHI